MSTNVAIFALAAFFEIAGCFAFWTWSRRGGAPSVALLGIGSLICFAVALTRVDSAFAGRAYAAYGGMLRDAKPMITSAPTIARAAPMRSVIVGR